MTRLLLLVLVVPLAWAQAPAPPTAESPPARQPDVSWPIHCGSYTPTLQDDEGARRAFALELEYYADGALRLRYAALDLEHANALGEWTRYEAAGKLNAWVLAPFRAHTEAIQRHIAAGEFDALRAHAEPLLVAHLLQVAPPSEAAQAKAQAELAAELVTRDRERYEAGVEQLRQRARRWLEGGERPPMLTRGPTCAPARLWCLAGGVALIAHRDERIELIRRPAGNFDIEGLADLDTLRRRYPDVHTAWYGPPRLPGLRSGD